MPTFKNWIVTIEADNFFPFLTDHATGGSHDVFSFQNYLITRGTMCNNTSKNNKQKETKMFPSKETKVLAEEIDTVLEGLFGNMFGGGTQNATTIPWGEIARTHRSLVQQFATSGTIDKIKALRDIVVQFAQLEDYAKKKNQPNLVKEQDKIAMKALGDLLKNVTTILKDQQGDKVKRLEAILVPLARQAMEATRETKAVRREETETTIDQDKLQNELILIYHHLEDIENSLEQDDPKETALSGISDAKEAVKRLAEMLPPEMAAELDRMSEYDGEDSPETPEDKNWGIDSIADETPTHP